MTSLDIHAQRDRRIVLVCLLMVTSLAWIYLGLSSSRMDTAMAGPHLMVWTSIDLLLMFVMWVMMMLGMMLPSASPMILTFVRINRAQAGTTVTPQSLVPAWVFAAGYIVIWTTFSLGATILQWVLQQLGMLSPMMASTSAGFTSVVLIGAYCVGCCWALMLLLFVGGVMNLVWIAVLALLVFVEKTTAPGRWPPRIVGTFLNAWGGSVLVGPILH